MGFWDIKRQCPAHQRRQLGVDLKSTERGGGKSVCGKWDPYCPKKSQMRRPVSNEGSNRYKEKGNFGSIKESDMAPVKSLLS